MSPLWLGPGLTLACAAVAVMAWWWAPALVAGTALADLGLLVGFGAVLACLRMSDLVVDAVLRRDGHGH